MDKEEGEKRDFLPSFFKNFHSSNVQVFLEIGYGKKLGYSEEDYLRVNSDLKFVDRNTVFKQNLIVVIRVPEIESLELMNPSSGLLSMLHYETRPALLEKLKENHINSFSLDSIVDDFYRRLVVSYEMTALGGVHTAFNELKKNAAQFKGKALKVSILGMGNLGFQAARYSFQEYTNQGFEAAGAKGVTIEFLEKEVTKFPDSIKEILGKTDLLIDATRRPDAKLVIIPNEWLEVLPESAVVLDLTADPYEIQKDGIQQKAIEGLPHGNIDKFIFQPDEIEWEKKIPSVINTANRRTAISCNAWPSVMAKECMEVYGEKIWPFINVLLNKGCNPQANSDDKIERALARATISYFEEHVMVSR